MKIPGSVIEEINTAVDMVQLIGENVDLKKRGGGWFGLCPFHSEKSPSFTVNPDKGFYHCFGCGAGGDAISFIMRYHNLEFPEAVLFLADKYGIRVDYEQGDGFSKDVISLHNDLVTYAVKMLYKPDNKPALDYLYKRALDDDVINDFSIGFLPDRYDVDAFKKKYGEKILIESGLFKEGQYGLKARFYNRIMFPIKNITGKTIAFSGRVMGDSLPKYVNSPETGIFKKRTVLYNMNRAKDFIKKEGFCLVTEGYMDVIRLAACGIGNAVASMGTSLTRDHISILMRYAEETIILFDGDDAGRNSALKSLEEFLQFNYFPYVLFLPSGEDPDSFLLKYGAEKFRELLKEKKDLMEYTIDILASASSGLNSRMNNLKRVRDKLLKIKDPYRKEHYSNYSAEKFGVDKNTLLSDLNISKAKKVIKKSSSKQATYLIEKEFISLLFKLPEDVAFSLLDDLNTNSFNDTFIKEIFKKIVEVFENGDSISVLCSDPNLGDELFSSVLIHAPDYVDAYQEAVSRRDIILERAQKNNINSKLKGTEDYQEQLKLLEEKFRLASKKQDVGNSEE